MKKFFALGSTMAFLLPVVVFAQAGGAPTVDTVLVRIGNILDTIIPILVTVAVIVFIAGVIQYVISTDEQAKKTARDRMIYGIIGIFLILSIWGIISLIGNTFGIQQGGAVGANDLPSIGA